MLYYVTLGANDEKKAHAFYTAVLAPLGIVPIGEHGGFGHQGGEAFLWIGKPFDGKPATFGNGTMVAFRAPSRAAVDRFHALCLANGGSDEGAPGLRKYAPDWYGAYARDPDGNKLTAVSRD
ncbi:MAG: VOC family protein [Alphaproteobacteria bacterium]|nr:VOC family protein [Alphaproteobacteria bacterium]